MDKDSLAGTSATEVRIVANKKEKSKLWKYLGFLATGSEDKLFVVSVWSCHRTLGTQLISPPILSTIIQQSILLS